MGLFKYTTPGAMTFMNQEIQGLEPDDIAWSTDPTLYAVLHCQTKYFSFQSLQKQFIRKFSMTPTTDMYILPAKYLQSPVLVVPDIEDNVTASTEDYLAILPRHKMGNYFLDHVRWYTGDSDDDDDEMEVDETLGHEHDW